MANHYLEYWKLKNVRPFLDLDPPKNILKHCDSSRYSRMEAGDEIWHVTWNPDTRDTFLSSHIVVGRVVDRDQAVKILEDEIRGADWVVIAREGTEEERDYINITDLLPELRFIGGRDRLNLDGNIPQQLQAIRRLTPESAELLLKRWTSFDESTDSDLKAGQTGTSDLLEERFQEGRLLVSSHKRLERNQALVRQAKETFRQRHGRLFCEVCGFDFGETYGWWGEGFIEAHHRKPLAEFNRQIELTVGDLAMVCANCHRMIHRQRREWLTVEKLREMIQEQSLEQD